jgi:ribosome-associated protein
MLKRCVFRGLVTIPREKITLIRTRASGPGGQNIQASNSKVQLKFDIKEASETWLDSSIAADLSRRFGKSVVIACQDSRSHIDNEKTAFEDLNHLLNSTEERLSRPKPGFQSHADYIKATFTENQIEKYKKRRMDQKKRAVRDRHDRSSREY